jgi:2-polyprenyl-3-methyl-5-hydroxy-6-metoxy-1,4-benzoquinol methylase/spore coat polysaccharide biosynthesis protein SpsF (cytidylyltransferase family)
MSTPRVIVQASSRAWTGGQDLCMRPIDGRPAVYWTIRRLLDQLPEASVHLAAPAFDADGALTEVARLFPAGAVSLYFGHDDSPLDRLLDVCRDLGDDEHVLRVDGLHFCVDVAAARGMLERARAERLDCLKFPDDFPLQFTADVYRVGACRVVAPLLAGDTGAAFRVHPKFYLFGRPDLFRCAYLDELPEYSDAHLTTCRDAAAQIYDREIPRQEVTASRLWAGDQLSYHYELAAAHLEPSMRVLDIACGDGYGSRMLAGVAAEVYGADLDPAAVAAASARGAATPNLRHGVEDVTATSFADATFDAVVSMETIEHVDADRYLAELRRIVRPGGTVILSTPQSRLGHIPVNTAHLREYSLVELLSLCGEYLRVESVIGIKAGRIVVAGDPIGTNTVVVCARD